MSPKDAKFPPRLTHLPPGWNCTSWAGTAKAIFLYAGRSHFKWPLLNHFPLMQLENLHHFLNITINFQFHAILYRWFMCTLIFCWRLAENYILSAKCIDWLHWWYNRIAQLVSTSSAMTFLNISEAHKSTSHSAIQVKNQWKKMVLNRN